MMAPMTTLKWSFHSLLENTSMCMETWMMMASMKVILEYKLLHLQFHISVFTWDSVFYCVSLQVS